MCVCVCVEASISDESCVRVKDGVNVILAITGVFKTEKIVLRHGAKLLSHYCVIQCYMNGSVYFCALVAPSLYQ